MIFFVQHNHATKDRSVQCVIRMTLSWGFLVCFLIIYFLDYHHHIFVTPPPVIKTGAKQSNHTPVSSLPILNHIQVSGINSCLCVV